jgi:hypothetical protein
MLVELTHDTAYFDFDDIHGSCEFKIVNITDEDYELELTNILSTQVIGEVELDYILTDAQMDALNEEIKEWINETTMIEEMQDPEDDYDEDAWRYDA